MGERGIEAGKKLTVGIIQAIYLARCATLFVPPHENPGVSTGASVRTESSNTILSDPGGVVCRTSTRICVVRLPEIDCGHVSRYALADGYCLYQRTRQTFTFPRYPICYPINS